MNVFSHTASAQVIKGAPISLADDVTNISTISNLYIFEDKFKKFKPADAWKEITGNQAQYRVGGKQAFLTQPNSAYWLALKIQNKSSSPHWAINFGDTFSGRSGFAKEITAYDLSARKMILKLSSSKPSENKNIDNLVEGALLFNAPIGQTISMLIYIEPSAKKPLIIAPELMKRSMYFARGVSGFDRYDLTTYIYLVLTFVMLTFFSVFRKAHQFLGAVFLLFGWLAFVVENSSLFLYVPFKEYMLFFSLILTLISGQFVFYSYFYDKAISPAGLRKIVFLGSLLALIITGFSVFAAPNEYAYLVFLIAITILCLQILYLMFSNMGSHIKDRYFFIVGGSGYAIAVWAGYVNIQWPFGDYSVYTSHAHVYAQLALSIFLIVSMPIRRPHDKKASSPLAGISRNVFQGGGKYRESKDMADRERLLRVLDRERELLEDARNREAEKTEEMRRAKDFADQANRAKSAFLAVISHEIRTPITGVLGMVKLLLGTQLSATQKDYAQTIQDSGDAMLSLLNDILDYEKIESGNLELEMISFDLQRLLLGVDRLMNGHAEAKRVGLVLTIEPDVPNFLVGDPTRIRQVLLNLVSNAIKFTEQGDVHILVKKIDVGTSDQKSTVTALSGDKKLHSIYFAIQDCGIGISPEAQRTLFTPFTQAKAETTRKYGGTGLGLSICQKLVQAMGGEISISSKENEGSTFFFTIDMQEGDQQEVMADEDNSGYELLNQSGRTFRILAVDDNSINLKVLNGFIDKLGHSCVKSESGEEAIELLQKESFDLVLMDVNMRGMSGLETTRQVRAMQHVEKSALPIVALTGNSGQDAVHECYDAGMDDFILKPVNPKNLNTIFTKLEASEFANEITSKKYKEIRQTLLNGEEDALSQSTTVEGAEATVDHVAPQDEIVSSIDDSQEMQPQISPQPEPAAVMSDDQEDDFSDLPPLPSQREESAFLNGGDDEIASADQAISDQGESFATSEVSPLQKMMSETDSEEAEVDVDEIMGGIGKSSGMVEDDSFIADIEARGDIFQSSLLEALKLSMDNEELKSLVAGFDEKAKEILGGIKQAHGSKDWTALAQRAHEMKGMSGNFGLYALSEMMKELEVVVKTQRYEEVEYFIVRIPMAYNLGIKKIYEWIG